MGFFSPPVNHHPKNKKQKSLILWLITQIFQTVSWASWVLYHATRMGIWTKSRYANYKKANTRVCMFSPQLKSKLMFSSDALAHSTQSVHMTATFWFWDEISFDELSRAAVIESRMRSLSSSSPSSCLTYSNATQSKIWPDFWPSDAHWLVIKSSTKKVMSPIVSSL